MGERERGVSKITGIIRDHAAMSLFSPLRPFTDLDCFPLFSSPSLFVLDHVVGIIDSITESTVSSRILLRGGIGVFVHPRCDRNGGGSGQCAFLFDFDRSQRPMHRVTAPAPISTSLKERPLPSKIILPASRARPRDLLNR